MSGAADHCGRCVVFYGLDAGLGIQVIPFRAEAQSFRSGHKRRNETFLSKKGGFLVCAKAQGHELVPVGHWRRRALPKGTTLLDLELKRIDSGGLERLFGRFGVLRKIR